MTYNLKFGKIEDGALTYAPNRVKWHNKTVFNPSEAKLRELGYKEVVRSSYNFDEVPEGYHVEVSYTEDDYTITVEYILVEDITE